MTAPALILLANGAEEIRLLRKQMQIQRPELPIHLAFLDHCPPSGLQVVSSLASHGTREAVFVPMSLTQAVDAGRVANGMFEFARRAHPGMNLAMARPIGPATELLTILDLRLRNALSSCHALELDGLVLATPSTGDVRGQSLIARRARQWSSHHKLPVAVASVDGSASSIAAAINLLRDQGRRNIAVGSLFLTASDRFMLAAEQGLSAGALTVSAPLGADERIIELVMSRYAFTAMDMLDDVPADEHLGDDVVTSSPELIAL
ncbi:CbiX/SirB N-terminal domain-containing protein [uncultured Propionibacterium sp.]|uniref:sirohydrochlorin chelatase n=1 Tax=uncultured Propionibacterium sp. TaxID=218066 RepID=UPI0029304621|nr:CbiX/SirB N-terminal domain-containing protein [uncultured Propionibacterium sp.]